MRAGSFLGRGDPIKAGYAGVEVPGGCNWVKCEGGLVWVKNPKTELLGLGFSQQKPGIHLGSPKVGADDVISILLSVSKQQRTSFLPPLPKPLTLSLPFFNDHPTRFRPYCTTRAY